MGWLAPDALARLGHLHHGIGVAQLVLGLRAEVPAAARRTLADFLLVHLAPSLAGSRCWRDDTLAGLRVTVVVLSARGRSPSGRATGRRALPEVEQIITAMVRPADSFCRTRLASEGTRSWEVTAAGKVNRPASEGAIGGFHQLMTSALRTASTAARPATAWRHGTRRASACRTVR